MGVVESNTAVPSALLWVAVLRASQLLLLLHMPLAAPTIDSGALSHCNCFNAHIVSCQTASCQCGKRALMHTVVLQESLW